ncbi:pyridoxal-phosphate dependent enzyme [Sediminicola sp. YIK13]|uniref:pyridoxal-phosphate dependent enzyme n=1 Tax=Sediminicola sp. YIK13 TaxID=1453352 RepID=UPI00078084E3|nr:pyridoxal-phosphate dependent enzyme [Sediminicola sp. YIK13]
MTRITKNLLLECKAIVQEHIHRTPVLTSTLLNELSGVDLFFKCENFQRAGSFKMRGAVHAISKLTAAQQAKGVVTHSSGNFAQALSLAARSIGVKAYIVMPNNAPQVKKNAVRSYGGEVIECEPNLAAREKAAEEIVEKHGATFLHPSNNFNVILGQGTAAMELLEDHPDLDFIMTPVGGGGLIAGTALAAHFFGHRCNTIGGEPFNVDDAYQSLKTGQIVKNESSDTIADGLRTELGNINFPIIMDYVEMIIRVEEKEIIDAMHLLWERMKIIIEPSCAVPFAALLKEKEFFKGKKVGIVLSGGNVDLGNLPF